MNHDSTVRVDRSVCRGYGNCVMKAPDYFDQDDDGLVFLRKPEAEVTGYEQAGDIDSDDFTRVEEAVKSCPVAALAIDRAS